MASAKYVADCLIWHQWEGRCLVLWRLVAPAKEDAGGMRQEWVGWLESTLSEAKGRGTEGRERQYWGHCQRLSPSCPRNCFCCMSLPVKTAWGTHLLQEKMVCWTPQVKASLCSGERWAWSHTDKTKGTSATPPLGKCPQSCHRTDRKELKGPEVGLSRQTY